MAGGRNRHPSRTIPLADAAHVYTTAETIGGCVSSEGGRMMRLAMCDVIDIVTICALESEGVERSLQMQCRVKGSATAAVA